MKSALAALLTQFSGNRHALIRKYLPLQAWRLRGSRLGQQRLPKMLGANAVHTPRYR